MARKPILAFVYLIASIFIVNTCNCQGGFPLSLAEPVTSLLIEMLCPALYSLPEPFVKPIVQTLSPYFFTNSPVPYPLNVKEISIDSSPEPPFQIHYRTEQVFKFYKRDFPKNQVYAGPSGDRIYLTGELLKDQKYFLKGIDIIWNNNYTKTYTAGDITDPYGHVTYSFRSSDYENPENKGNCSLIVNIVFYIEKKGTTVDPKYQPFLDMVREVKDLTTPFKGFKPVAFLNPFASIFEQPYFLYTGNFTIGEWSSCANFIVYPQAISIPEAEFTDTGSFGSSSAKNTFTPTTKCSKLVEYVESGIQLENY